MCIFVGYNTANNEQMPINIRYHLVKLSLIICILLCAGCSSWKTPASASGTSPDIFPDYKDVTVPYNIAPLNFMLEDADRIQARFTAEGCNPLNLTGKDGVISIPEKEWRRMLLQAKGRKVQVEVAAWTEEFPSGVSYEPFTFNVSADEIDPYISYRLIEPGYVGWRQLGIYQRNLASFEESALVTNRESNTTCLNCHHYPAYSTESMMFHARGANGGTILYHDGELRKIDFKSIGPKKNTTYPAWHPEGRYIAFSSNTTHQVFFGEGEQPIEVFDTASDLVVYDIETGEVLTDPRFMTEDVLETFPSWSPDGRYLYFASFRSPVLPVYFNPGIRYDLMRVSFDQQTGRFGDEVDLLYDTSVRGGSISHPRVSPDGRYLLYTWSEYGTFPVWHEEADLKMMDLQTLEDVDVSVWNDPDDADSYHSWSSDGRWAMIGSRRLDGRYTRLYIAYLDEEGNPHKPFLLPQEDPRHNTWRLKSYNVPEFMTSRMELPGDAADLFYTEQ